MLRIRKLPFVRRFAASEHGIAAAEFAMFAPILIGLYFGVTELTDGFSASTKVTAVAATAADLPAQDSRICNSEMSDIFAALNSVIFPYSPETLQVVITSVVEDGNGQTRVAWSDAHNASPRAVNSVVTLPLGLVAQGSGGSVIMSEVKYDYSSPTGQLLYGLVRINDVFYSHPRRSSQVARTVNNC